MNYSPARLFRAGFLHSVQRFSGLPKAFAQSTLPSVYGRNGAALALSSDYAEDCCNKMA